MEKHKPDKQLSAKDKLLDKTADTLNWWNRLATINAEDPIWVSVLKIGVRILGILFLLMISPLVILGLIIGITAAF